MSFDSDIRLACPPPCGFLPRSPQPIAAASLGQVYKGVLRSTGEAVAVKVGQGWGMWCAHVRSGAEERDTTHNITVNDSQN